MSGEHKVKIGVIHFDEHGVVREDCVEVSQADLAECMAPVRFVGGGCDRYYTCTYAAKSGCQATASINAREKKEHEKLEQGLVDTIDGEEVREDLKCVACGEIIQLEGGDAPYHGEEGTAYAGKSVCDSCYDEDLSEPSATVYYGTDDESNLIGSCRNETEGQFRARWHSTDPWRGYYELESDSYIRVFDDAILSGHESEEMLKKLHDIVRKRFAEEEVDYARGFCRSSNVFMSCLELWVKKDVVQVTKAMAIIMQAKAKVGYDDPVYSTGILVPRETMDQFNRLMAGKYTLETDSDLWHLVEDKGAGLISELQEAASGNRHS